MSHKILLVEDNFLIGVSLKEALEEMDFQVIGPIASLEEGKRLAAEEELDAAILDIHIRGGMSEEIARELERRGCPFCFLTGYGSPEMLSPDLRAVLRLTKPVYAATLEQALFQDLGLPRSKPNGAQSGSR